MDNETPDEQEQPQQKRYKPVQELNFGPQQAADYIAAANAQQKRNPTKEIAKEAGKQIIKEGVQEASKSGLAVLFGPPFIGEIACVVILILIFLLVWLSGAKSQQDQKNTDNNQNTPQLTLTKSAPAKVANSTNYDYQITYDYPLPAQNLSIQDQLPEGVNFISTSPPKSSWDAASRTVTWKLSDNQQPNSGSMFNPIKGTLTITVQPTKPDIRVYNILTGQIIGAGSSVLPGSGPIPPTTNDCGRYGTDLLKSPDHLNFGDPNCQFDYRDPKQRDQILQILKQNDPQNQQNAIILFTDVASCESGYNPNAYLANSTSQKGAYGIFQMNPAGQGNGPLDNGQTVWNLQTENAGKYNVDLENKGIQFCYWACAKAFWPKDQNGNSLCP